MVFLGLALLAGGAWGQTYDYGDYSLFSSAASTVNSRLKIGSQVDAEYSATTNSTATGDDVTDDDDEDGVTLPGTLQLGASSSLTVNVTNTRGSTAYLNVWIDWNNNGSLTDSGEQIASNTTISNNTSNSNRTVNFTVPSGASLGTVGVRVRLTSSSSPGSTGTKGYGEVEDYTITVGNNLGVGNLVWNDANDNGRFDDGESGINNVQVELWSPGTDNVIGGTGGGADTKLAITNTSGGGLYSFTGLSSGKYFVKVPTPPLSRVSSVVDTSDNGQDSNNNGSQPGGSGTASYSGVFDLVSGTEPGSSGTGNTDNTIDFGFVSNVGAPFVCDNRFYIMQNVETYSGSGNWDTTLNYIESDQSLVPIFIFSGKKLNGLVAYGGYLYCVDQNAGHLYRINALGTLVDMGEIDGLPGGTDGQWGGATALTSGRMILNRYTFSNARTTLYTIELGSASVVGSPIVCKYSTTNNYTSGNFGDIVWDPLTDKIYGYNTNDSSNLGLFEINTTTGICTRVASSYLSTFGSLVIDANGLAYGYGSQSSSTTQDTLYVFNRTNGVLNGSMTAVGTGRSVTNSDGAACPGAAPSMKIGNLVWSDTNNNGVKDSGEAGIDGVQLQLFLGGEDPLTATPATSVTTSGGGVYTFSDLSPGQYFVYIPTPPSGFPLSSSVTVTADNGQDNDDNGIQTSSGLPVRSPLISLVAGTEPTSDGDSDSNTDLTMDFGFRACPSVTVSGTPAGAIVNTSYSHTFSASGGSSPYTWSLVSGTLPTGLTLSSAGVLSGTPTVTNGSGVSVTVRATDSLGCQGSSTVTLVVSANTDFGDYSSFPSASSIVSTALRIGTLVDAETTATTNASATGDDITGGDDEDGVELPASVGLGTAASLNVTVTNTSGSSAFLNAWIDFNRNGSLNDSGEQIASNVSVANGSSNSVRTINFNVPAAAFLGASAVRVRLTSVSTPGPDGADGTGEVEDHAISIIASLRDYSDFSGLGTASSLMSTNLLMGTLVDGEASATTNSGATGDDNTGSDDEDGVTIPVSLEMGATVTIPITVTNNTGGNAYLHAWIDFNNDGVLNNATLSSGGERLEAARLIQSVSKGSIFREWWLGISGTAVSDLTSNSAYPNSPTGSDVLTSFETPTDWNSNMGQRVRGWVYPPTTGNYTFWVAGDDESKLFLSTDDSAANAVLIANVPGWTSSREWTKFSEQKSVTISLQAGRAYYIEALMKEGGGGDNLAVAWEFAGSGTGPVVIDGSYLAPYTANGASSSIQEISFTVPVTASAGSNRGARFWLSDTSATTATGESGTGEVEDYVVTITPPPIDFGDWSGAADASSYVISTLKLGALVDTEVSSTLNATATGDDITGSDDEDGVSLPASLNLNGSGALVATITNNSGATAYLNAWVDFNGNGSFNDSGEQIVTNNSISTGSSGVTRSLNFSAPSNAKPGERGVRVRLTNVQNPGATGAAGTGEVEDYTITINCPTISLSPATLTTPVVGYSYNQTFTSNGGTSPYTFTVTSGSLPSGLTLSSGGSLTGTATNTTPTNFTVTGTDANGCSTSINYNVTPVCPAIPISPSSLQNPTVGSSYSQTITASGGTAPYTFTIASGSLPPGLTLGLNNGLVSGTTTQAGAVSFTLLVTDFYGCSATQNYSVTPSCPSVSVTPSSLPAGAVGSSYSQTLSATGGVAPYSYVISSGALPAGLTLSSDGLLSGSPTTGNGSGTAFIIRATDSRGCMGTRAYSVKICPVISMSPSSLSEIALGVSYSQTITSSGGVAPYTYALSSGTLPNGLSLSSSGVLSGTPGTAGTSTFTVRSTDANSCTGTQAYTVTVRAYHTLGNLVWNDTNNNGLRDSGEPGMSGLTAQLYTSTNSTAGDGDDVLYSGGINQVTTSATGAYSFADLPSGKYVVKVTPPSGYQTSGVPVTTDNSQDNDNNGSQPGGVGTALFSPVITLSPNGESTSDGDSDANTDLTVDFGLFAGITLGDLVWVDANNNGVKDASELGVSNVTVQLMSPGTDNQIGGTGSGADSLVATTQTNESGGYSFLVYTSGRYYVTVAPTSTYSLTSSSVVTSDNAVDNDNNGSQPGGIGTLIYSPVIQLTAGGEPGSSGTSNTENTLDFGLRSCPVLSLSPSSLVSGTVGSSYSQTLAASGGSTPYVYSVVIGSLPAGLSLNSSSGLINGVPTSATSASFTVRAVDSSGCLVTRDYTVLPVCPAVSITTSSLPTGAMGVAYNQTLAATGGTSPYTWSLASGSLPSGLSLNASNGAITGTPTAGNGAGTSITFRVVDTYGCAATSTLLLKVCPSITLSPTTLSGATSGTAYSQTITATGGVSPYTYTLASGGLPAGLSLSSAGVISGTPTSISSTSFIVRATDANDCAGTRAYALTPACASVVINTASLPFAYLNTAYSTSLSASAGVAPYTWSLSSGTLPTGLTLSSGGIISGTPTSLGSASITVRVADANGCATTRVLTLTVKGLTLGNRVWLDNDNDGLMESGEPGVPGASVQLFNPGSDNAIGGTGGAADVQVGLTVNTAADGAYSFTNLPPGNYYVKVTAPAAYTHTSGTPATADNNVDGNNDGAQPGGPGTPLYSPIISLQPGEESTIDGDGDADTNLTVDFGLWAPLAVGNMVFLDINRDDRMNANEGITNVFIQLFREGANVQTDVAVNAAITDDKGRYIMTGIDPGSYFLHIAAIQFDAGGVLFNTKPMASVVAGDDDGGQNLLVNNTPSVGGASTAVFTLIPGQLASGSAESGTEGVADDDGVDSNTDLTYDLGLVAEESAFIAIEPPAVFSAMSPPPLVAEAESELTFAAWQAAHPLDGKNAATDNPDSDLYANLLEYALGTDPANGASGAGRFLMETQATTGAVDVLVKQPLAGRQDIVLTLETSVDAQTWTPARVPVQTTFDQMGDQTQRYAGLDSQVFAGAARGLVRLKVVLDADLNGAPEATATTPAWMYSRELFSVGTRSFSMPLEQPELYVGLIASREGDQALRLDNLSGLELSSPAVLDVLDGSHAGEHFIISQVQGNLITSETLLPQDVIGARVALRALWSLDQLLPADLFARGANAETADRVLQYGAASNDFTSVWLSENGWTNEAASAVGLAPGQAWLVQARTQNVTVLLAGQVPQVSSPVLPESGTRFMAGHRVQAASPTSLNLTTAAGFQAGTQSAEAARLRLWKADADPAATGYESLYLRQTESGAVWIREEEASPMDVSQEELLTPFHGFFLLQP